MDLLGVMVGVLPNYSKISQSKLLLYIYFGYQTCSGFRIMSLSKISGNHMLYCYLLVKTMAEIG